MGGSAAEPGVIPVAVNHVFDIIQEVKHDEFFPADLLFLACTNPDGICYTERSRLRRRLCQFVMAHQLQQQQKNKKLKQAPNLKPPQAATRRL